MSCAAPPAPAPVPEGAPVPGFEPRIVGFLCSWCAYAGADKAGASQQAEVAPGLRVVRLLCTGRMDPQFAVKAFDEGADGVLVLGCHPGDCHYKEQNLRALHRHRLLLRLLAARGIDPRRCRFDFVGASEGGRFVRIVQELREALQRLGPFTTR